MDETKLSILEKTGSTDVRELVAEVRRLRELVRRVAKLEAELRQARDVLRESAPQSWAAGTNLYENALSWERDAVACIARIATIVSE